MTSAVQDWVSELTMMQQSVLFAAIRGPDALHKNHVSKLLLRWFRRCVLLSAFDGRVIYNPWERGGGSFTGPSIKSFISGAAMGRQYWVEQDNPMYETWQMAMHTVLDEYMLRTDEIPHHFQLHFLHAAEIIGFKHPNADIRTWWKQVYTRLCNDMHLIPEAEHQMDRRLGDKEQDWRASEEVTAT